MYHLETPVLYIPIPTITSFLKASYSFHLIRLYSIVLQFKRLKQKECHPYNFFKLKMGVLILHQLL